jgi:hypothetical protein
MGMEDRKNRNNKEVMGKREGRAEGVKASPVPP